MDAEQGADRRSKRVRRAAEVAPGAGSPIERGQAPRRAHLQVARSPLAAALRRHAPELPRPHASTPPKANRSSFARCRPVCSDFSATSTTSTTGIRRATLPPQSLRSPSNREAGVSPRRGGAGARVRDNLASRARWTLHDTRRPVAPVVTVDRGLRFASRTPQTPGWPARRRRDRGLGRTLLTETVRGDLGSTRWSA